MTTTFRKILFQVTSVKKKWYWWQLLHLACGSNCSISWGFSVRQDFSLTCWLKSSLTVELSCSFMFSYISHMLKHSTYFPTENTLFSMSICLGWESLTQISMHTNLQLWLCCSSLQWQSLWISSWSTSWLLLYAIPMD